MYLTSKKLHLVPCRHLFPYSHAKLKDTCSHVKTVLMVIFDPQNMGLEAIILQLSVTLAKICEICS